MSIQTLSAKSTRRVARALDLPTLTRAWVDNEHHHQLVHWATWDHEHGWYDRRTGDWGYDTILAPWHMPSCYAPDGTLLLDLDPLDDDGHWPTLRD